MTSPIPVAPFSRDENGGRQSALVARERWEGAWLAEQRDAMAVIKQDGGAPQQTDHAPAFHAAADPDALATDVRIGDRTAVAPRRSLASSAASDLARTPGRQRDRRVSQATQSTAILAGTNTATQSGTAAKPAAASAPAMARSELRNSAFWRHDDAGISAAVRIRDPERNAFRVIAQMREWIREAGGYLRKVLINGRMAWSAADSNEQQSPDARRSQLNRQV